MHNHPYAERERQAGMEEAVFALKKNWNDIAGGVADASVGSLNVSLWSREIYDDKVRDAIDAKPTAYEKMNEMLKALEKKIKRDPAAFNKFLEVLRDESTYDDLADILENTRGELATGWFILLLHCQQRDQITAHIVIRRARSLYHLLQRTSKSLCLNVLSKTEALAKLAVRRGTGQQEVYHHFEDMVVLCVCMPKLYVCFISVVELPLLPA